MTGRLLGIAAAAASAVLGILTAVPVVMLHGRWPGLAIGVLCTAALTWAIPARGGRRLLFVGGCLLVVGLGSVPRPEGDYLIAADTRGYTVLVGALVLMCVGLWTGIARWGDRNTGNDDSTRVGAST